MSELKRTSYKPSSVVLGSRQHFCVHSSVSRYSGARQNAMCKRAVDDHKCPFHVGFRKNGGKVSTALKDMEEIVESCKEATVCPYYKVREDAKEAELLLLPYDYLIGTGAREAMQVSLRNSILIFDEGHNIERSCEETASFELTSQDLGNAIAEIDDAFELVKEGEVNTEDTLGDMHPEMMMRHLNLVKQHLIGLEESIYSEKMKKDSATDRNMFKARGSHVVELLGRSCGEGVATSKEDLKHMTALVKRACSILTYSQETATSGGRFLDKVLNFLATAFKHNATELDSNYQVLIYEESKPADTRPKKKAMDFFTQDYAAAKDKTPRTLCLWCFSSSVTMQELMKHELHSVIITSGTLSPLAGTVEAFGMPFPVVLENSHVIDPRRQLFGGVLTCGPEQICLDSSFDKRNENAYIKDLGNSVKQLAACVPDGLLLAFSSYTIKETVMQAWSQSGLLDSISSIKPVFEEPKGNMETKQMMEKYNAALARSPAAGGGVGGAILAAVCRGKLCEGIDFTDRQCRMVIMVGVPYPSKNDLRVVLKQDFLDAKGSQGDGKRWYQREAIRAVNQTLGRVIRHRKDYGAVILCDSRYASGNRVSGIASGLSSWMRPQISVFKAFEVALNGCRTFFGRQALNPAVPARQLPAKSDVAQPSVPVETSSPDAKLATTSPVGRSAPSGGGNKQQLKLLGEIWRGLKRPIEAAASPALTPKVATPQVATQQVATPQVAKSAANSSGQERLKQQRLQKPRTPSAFGRASDAMRTAAPVVDTVSGQWLKRAEKLLPVMEMDVMRTNLALARSEADEIASGRRDSDAKLNECLKKMAECLLPEMCFDTPEEERSRHALVREAPQLLPKLLRPLWKSSAEEVLRVRGMSQKIW